MMSPELATAILGRAKARMGERATAAMPDNRGKIVSPRLRALWRDWQNPTEEDDFFRPVSDSKAMARVGSRLLRGRDVRWWLDTILCKLPASEGGARTPWHQASLTCRWTEEDCSVCGRR